MEITEVVLVHCNNVHDNYEWNSRALYIFVPNKSLGKLSDIPPKNFMLLKAFHSEFSYVEGRFTDQTSNPLEIEEKISITLVKVENILKHKIKSIIYKKWRALRV